MHSSWLIYNVIWVVLHIYSSINNIIKYICCIILEHAFSQRSARYYYESHAVIIIILITVCG